MCHGHIVETFYHVPECPCTIALIADTHNCSPYHILRSLHSHAPDIICIAGDIILGFVPKQKLKMEESQNAIDLLTACAGITSTYFSLGNHERILSTLDLRMIKSTGVIVLDNDWDTRDNLVIGGLSPSRVLEYRAFRTTMNTGKLYPQPRKAMSNSSPQPDLNWLDNYCSQPGYHILLCHHPEYYPIYLANRQIDLILSGHAHGGQIRFYNPFKKEWRGVFAPGQGFLPHYSSGVIDSRLVISRGLSNTLIVPRLNNPLEMVYINAKR